MLVVSVGGLTLCCAFRVVVWFFVIESSTLHQLSRNKRSVHPTRRSTTLQQPIPVSSITFRSSSFLKHFIHQVGICICLSWDAICSRGEDNAKQCLITILNNLLEDDAKHFEESERGDYNEISFASTLNCICRRSICSLSASHVISILPARHSTHGKY